MSGESITASVVELTPVASEEKPKVKKATRKPTKKSAPKKAVKKVSTKKTTKKTAKPAKKAGKSPKKAKVTGGHKAQTQVDGKAWSLLTKAAKAKGCSTPADFIRLTLYRALKYAPKAA